MYLFDVVVFDGWLECFDEFEFDFGWVGGLFVED